MKKCSRCKEEKDINEFGLDKNRPDGRYPVCKKCLSEERKRKIIGKWNPVFPRINAEDENKKWCRGCNETKDIDLFSHCSATTDKHVTYCKECAARKHQERSNKIQKEREELKDNIPETKICTKCGIEKSLDLFYARIYSIDGKSSMCKDCNFIYRNSSEFKEMISINYEEMKKKRLESYVRNRESRVRAASEWAKRNPEKRKKYDRTARHKRRAAKVSAEGSHNAEDISILLEKQDWICYYCFAFLPDAGWQIDHKQPLSRSGSNWPENLAITCSHCNLSKGYKTETEFWDYLEFKRSLIGST